MLFQFQVYSKVNQLYIYIYPLFFSEIIFPYRPLQSTEQSSLCYTAGQNIQTAHAAKYQKNKQPNPKMGGRSKQTLLQRRRTDGQKAHEKMLNITNYQSNANQNYNEVLPHTGQNGHHKKIYKQQILERVWRKGNPPTLLVRM